MIPRANLMNAARKKKFLLRHPQTSILPHGSFSFSFPRALSPSLSLSLPNTHTNRHIHPQCTEGELSILPGLTRGISKHGPGYSLFLLSFSHMAHPIKIFLSQAFLSCFPPLFLLSPSLSKP